MNSIKLVRYLYVKSAHIKQIKKQAEGKTFVQWLKAEYNVGKYIMSEGYKDSKTDISYYFKNYRKNLSPSQLRRTHLILSNILKVPPIAILFWVPLGLPLVLSYMAFLPALTPTWFLVDTYQEQIIKIKKQKQLQSLKFFIKCGSIKLHKNEDKIQISTTINQNVFSRMSLFEQKKVHQLCYGQAVDGTGLMEKTLKIKFDSFISPSISSYILYDSLKKKLEGQQNPQNQQTDKLNLKVLKEAQNIINQNSNEFLNQEFF